MVGVVDPEDGVGRVPVQVVYPTQQFNSHLIGRFKQKGRFDSKRATHVRMKTHIEKDKCFKQVELTISLYTCTVTPIATIVTIYATCPTFCIMTRMKVSPNP